MRKLKILGAVLVAVFASGCATVSSPVGNGLFTSVNGPVTMTEHVASKKKGEACASNILGLIATGDASIETARRAAGIAKVSSVDHSSFSIFFLYSKFCTIAYGE